MSAGTKPSGDHPHHDDPSTLAQACGDCGECALEERNAAWDAKTTVKCSNCGAGGHIATDGSRHGPAFVSLPQTNRRLGGDA